MANPTTSVTIYAHRDDGWLKKSSQVSHAALGGVTPVLYGAPGRNLYLRVGQRYSEPKGIPTWEQARGYLCFNTSTLANEIIDGATLYLAAKADNSNTEFNITPYSQGSTPWGPGLATSDWAKCETAEATLGTGSIAVLNTYYGLTVATTSINTSGFTYFRLKSGRESVDPDLGPDSSYLEDIDLWAADGSYPPKLVLALRVPRREAIVLDILSTLRGIDGTGNYNYDLSGTGDDNQVWRTFRTWDQLQTFPAVSVLEGDCAYSEIATSPTEYTAGSPSGSDGWPIDLIATFECDADLSGAGSLEKVGENLESDIKIAMLTDPQRGNSDFVVGTYHRATIGPVRLANTTKGAIRMVFDVKYDWLTTAP